MQYFIDDFPVVACLPACLLGCLPPTLLSFMRLHLINKRYSLCCTPERKKKKKKEIAEKIWRKYDKKEFAQKKIAYNSCADMANVYDVKLCKGTSTRVNYVAFNTSYCVTSAMTVFYLFLLRIHKRTYKGLDIRWGSACYARYHDWKSNS